MSELYSLKFCKILVTESKETGLKLTTGIYLILEASLITDLIKTSH